LKRFALIGAAGFVAARHLRAIHDTSNILVAAMDKFDSVGILDSYFPNADFFIEFERFDRHLEKLKREHEGIDYLSVCTPNYLHDAHVRFGLRHGASVICEKPLVLNPWNLEALASLEQETGNKVYTILQLRLHPDIIELKRRIGEIGTQKKHEIDLEYITPRGHWYHTSWKGDISKSGGIATNIGIHFFDMLVWIFGKVQQTVVHLHTKDRAAGYLELEHARVRWFLSINDEDLPLSHKQSTRKQFRSIKVSGEEIEFSTGFTDLHTKSYEAILKGNGFHLDEVLSSIQLVHDIRIAEPIGLKGEVNPMVLQIAF
jgi:UDP-N-acetyl-2-amino-2-deoxyglucuronate dehydrogenase